MPTNDDYRLSVNFTKRLDLLKLIKQDAELEDRSISSIIVRGMAAYYEQRKVEAELFTRPQLNEAKKSDALIFEDVDQLPAETSSKLRDSLRREKS